MGAVAAARTSYGKCVDARHHYKVLIIAARMVETQLDEGSCLSRVFPILRLKLI